jgi:membrane-bound lytic murein transglycosylase B
MPVSRSSTWRSQKPTGATIGQRSRRRHHHAQQRERANRPGWNYLAAINLVETGLGRIVGVTPAGAQGPMQFLPATFAKYGDGGDIRSPHDSIMAAGRFLAANGFAPATTTAPSSGTTTPTATSGRSTTTPGTIAPQVFGPHEAPPKP